MKSMIILAAEIPDAALALGVALLGGLPAWAAVYFSNKASRRVNELAPVVEATAKQVATTGNQVEDEMLPLAKSTDHAVNNTIPNAITLRQTAEATHEIAAKLEDQETARVAERAADKIEQSERDSNN